VLEDTMFFSSKDIEKALVKDVLNEVYYALKEKGYNPINQIVGYLETNDASYISSYKNSRNKILGLEKAEILAVILEGYYNL